MRYVLALHLFFPGSASAGKYGPPDDAEFNRRVFRGPALSLAEELARGAGHSAATVVVPPVVARARSPRNEAYAPDDLGPFQDPDTGEDATEFKKNVYRLQLDLLKERTTEKFRWGLGSRKLAEVEGNQFMAAPAADDCKALLAQARRDLAQAQAAGDADALKMASIGVRSGYRSAAKDKDVWENNFSLLYTDTKKERKALSDDPYGPEIVEFMAKKMSGYKAIPGFSNHNKGIAMDFRIEMTPKNRDTPWNKTWFYKWLTQNAGQYGFQPYAREEWHWDHAVTLP